MLGGVLDLAELDVSEVMGRMLGAKVGRLDTLLADNKG